MKSCPQTDAWIRCFFIASGIFVIVSLVVFTILAIIGRHVPEIVIVLDLMATVGLCRLLISPL